MSTLIQNAHLTFKANMGVGRHGWLRLTPAYSVALVRERLAAFESSLVVFDPFSGTGTTPLAAAELGHLGVAQDVNPFLVWLGNAKLHNYHDKELAEALEGIRVVTAAAVKSLRSVDLWRPNLFRIEKWWSGGPLSALAGIRSALDGLPAGPASDLLTLAFCKTLISCSNAAFNHQSMSFKPAEANDEWNERKALGTIDHFEVAALALIEDARVDLSGHGHVRLADSRSVPATDTFDLVLTSPPYVNRMSYIRELRPYMYWTRHLDDGADAGELDWKAIGGTWGMATSRLNSWRPSETGTPVDAAMDAVRAQIAIDGGKNGLLLSNYVGKYFHDMWEHFSSIQKKLIPGGMVSYIVGNSTFYGNVVPAEEWYAEMLRSLGFEDVKVTTIRKRNSKKELFEFDVTGVKPV